MFTNNPNFEQVADQIWIWKNFVTKELSGLNHLFQECKAGSPDEYGEIEQTFSPIALEVVLNWIHLQLK